MLCNLADIPNDLEALVVSIFRVEEQQVPPKRWEQPTGLHGITSSILYADKITPFI
jgi:hypothetical protein